MLKLSQFAPYRNETIKISQNIVEDFSKVEIKVGNSGSILKKTICVGIDLFDSIEDNSIDDTIKNADIALYEAKNKGRSEVVYFKKEQASTIDLF